jgi:hypothetical protein
MYILSSSVLLVCSVVSDTNSFNQSERAKNTTELLDFLLDGYDSRFRPGFGGKFTLYKLIALGVS